MKTEYAYGTICTLLRAYDADAGRDYAEHVIADPARYLKHENPVYSSAAALLADLRLSMDSRTTPKTVAAAVKRVIANVSSVHSDAKGIFTRDGRFHVCDGFRLIRLNDDITSLPHVDYDFNVEAVMKDVVTSGGTLTLPGKGEIKAFLASEKARKKKEGARNFTLKPMCIDGWTYVNPQYLLDMLEALPGSAAYRPKRPIDPIYFRADNGDGILCPVRPPKEYAETA